MQEERREQDIESGEEGAGHPARDTSPVEGVDPGMHEHPEDVRQPADQERDETDTESPGTPPNPDHG